MTDCVIVPTYKRDELLHGCLRRLRGQDGDIQMFVFSDRGVVGADTQAVCDEFEAQLIVQPQHAYYGNSFSAGEALRFAYNMGFDLIHYVEDDAFVKADFFDWTLRTHEEFPSIFCSCGWVFNRFMELEECTYFAPWIYIPQFSIKREKLELVLPHLCPLYYANMKKYILANFAGNPLEACHPTSIQHFEIDGLLQRVMMEHRFKQVAWNAVAKIEHMGAWGYNRGQESYAELFAGRNSFAERVARIEELHQDAYERMHLFGREIVERECGEAIPPRYFRYRMQHGEYESEFTSELLAHQLPKMINSVPRTAETVITSL